MRNCEEGSLSGAQHPEKALKLEAQILPKERVRGRAVVCGKSSEGAVRSWTPFLFSQQPNDDLSPTSAEARVMLEIVKRLQTQGQRPGQGGGDTIRQENELIGSGLVM